MQKPYTPGDEEAYENDLLQRAEAGEYYNPDSIKTDGEKFKTRLGRTVYGGGGIIPDYFIPRDTIGYTSYFREVLMNGQMATFAYHFVDKHRAELGECRNHKDVSRFLNTHNYIEEFATFADQRGTKRRNLMIITSHALLERFLTSYIISDILDTQDAVEYTNLTDPTVLKALEIIRNHEAFPKYDKAAAKVRHASRKVKTYSTDTPTSGKLVCIAGRRRHYLLWG